MGLLRFAEESLHDGAEATEYHTNLLQGLRSLVGCDGALFRQGSRWAGAETIYLDADTRFTDGYVNQAERFRPEVETWCRLSMGDRAIIDTEVYSTDERRKKAIYGDVIMPAQVKSIMGCPLTVGDKQVGLIFLYRTGSGRPFRADQARALDPLLKGLALAELALARPKAKSTVADACASLPRRLRPVFDLLLTGKSEKEIAAALSLSVRTVHKYTEQTYRLLNAHSRAELLAHFVTEQAAR